MDPKVITSIWSCFDFYADCGELHLLLIMHVGLNIAIHGMGGSCPSLNVASLSAHIEKSTSSVKLVLHSDHDFSLPSSNHECLHLGPVEWIDTLGHQSPFGIGVDSELNDS